MDEPRKFWQRWQGVARGLLARLSDEDAFARFLQRTGQRATATAWEQFLHERHAPSRNMRRCC